MSCLFCVLCVAGVLCLSVSAVSVSAVFSLFAIAAIAASYLPTYWHWLQTIGLDIISYHHMSCHRVIVAALVTVWSAFCYEYF